MTEDQLSRKKEIDSQISKVQALLGQINERVQDHKNIDEVHLEDLSHLVESVKYHVRQWNKD